MPQKLIHQDLLFPAEPAVRGGADRGAGRPGVVRGRGGVVVADAADADDVLRPGFRTAAAGAGVRLRLRDRDVQPPDDVVHLAGDAVVGRGQRVAPGVALEGGEVGRGLELLGVGEAVGHEVVVRRDALGAADELAQALAFFGPKMA